MTPPEYDDPIRTAAQREEDAQRAREAEEKTATEDEKEEEAVEVASHLSARMVYHVVRHEGEDELSRPNISLFWSGIAAGICISLSVIGEAIFAEGLPPSDWLFLVESLGYTLGFLIVIVGRMQLFTENTITTVLPFLAAPSVSRLESIGRLWGIVIGANVIGCFIAAFFLAYIPAFDPGVIEHVRTISIRATEHGAWVGFCKAIPAGLLIAALVWMMASGSSGNFILIIIMTWLIAAGGFTHIIAGTVEMAYLLLTGDMGIAYAIFGFWLPVLAGNVVGGTLVFALITWGQVRDEVKTAGAE